jgi:hypothetical protein
MTRRWARAALNHQAKKPALQRLKPVLVKATAVARETVPGPAVLEAVAAKVVPRAARYAS